MQRSDSWQTQSTPANMEDALLLLSHQSKPTPQISLMVMFTEKKITQTFHGKHYPSTVPVTKLPPPNFPGSALWNWFWNVLSFSPLSASPCQEQEAPETESLFLVEKAGSCPWAKGSWAQQPEWARLQHSSDPISHPNQPHSFLELQLAAMRPGDSTSPLLPQS